MRRVERLRLSDPRAVAKEVSALRSEGCCMSCGSYDHSDIGSVSLWMFTNFGPEADCEKQRIPNAALEFVYQIARNIPDTEVNRLIDRDTKNYQTSLLNCVINRRDYLKLYPSKKYGNDGASHRLFMLYQTIVLGHSVSSLRDCLQNS